MGFDFSAFAGAVCTLSEAIDKTAALVGIPRDTLARVLQRRAKVRKDRWEESLWRSARSKKELSEWIYRRARDFEIDDESEILKIARTIPHRIRRSLIEIAKTIPASRGGKSLKLDPIECWRIRSAVTELHKKGMPKEKAFEAVAKRKTRSGHKVSAHTVRRICDPRERERSRQSSREARKETGAAFIELDPRK